MVDPGYFTTQRRIDALASLKARAATGTLAKASETEKHGTVGAVARDAAAILRRRPRPGASTTSLSAASAIHP